MRKGFTLIELLIAMAIMVILAAAGTSISLQASRRKAVETTADKLQSLLQEARSNAQASKVGSCNSPLLGWQVKVNSNTAVLQLVCQAATSDILTYTYPSGVTVSPTPTILYNRMGSTNLTADTTLSVNGVITKQIIITTSGDVK